MNLTKTTASCTANPLDAVMADATAGAITVTLPNPAPRVRVSVTKVDSSGNAVTVQPAPGSGAACLIDGAANLALAAQHTARAFLSDGTAWFVVA